MALTPRETALFPLRQSESADAQAASASPQAVSTNSHGVSATLPQANRQTYNGNSPQAQRSVLAIGPNFAVTPRHPPILEYIITIESVCTNLGQQDAEELRAEINRVLRSSYPLNLT